METQRSTWIYGKKDEAFKKELERLKETLISQRNKDLIMKFHSYLFAKGSRQLRVSKLSSELRRICLKLNKDLDKATKDDILRIVAFYNQDPKYKEATKSDYRRSIKQFYRWFEEEDERLYSKNEDSVQEARKLYRYLQKEVKVAYLSEKINPKDILNDDEIDKIVQNCRSIRDKALIKFLHETGTRAGEILNIQIGDLDIKEDYCNVTLDGKTGQRTIPIVNSLPYIVQYLSIHPDKDNPKSYLWMTNCKNRPNKPLVHRACQKVLDVAFRRAKLKDRRHNMHWFRHSRASILAAHLNEALLCQYMGWVIGSREVRTYTHLQPKQLQNKVLELKGLIVEKDQSIRPPQRCVCGCINDTSARYCYKCGKPLNLKVVLEDKQNYDQELDKSIKLLMDLAKDPELMKRFEKFRNHHEV